MTRFVFSRALQALLLLAIVQCESQGLLAQAEDSVVRKGWWGELSLGGGSLSRSGAGLDQDDTKFFMGLGAGYVVHPQVLLGVELSGWLIEPTQGPPNVRGAGIMQAFATGRIYPLPDSGLFFKAGGGYVSNWDVRAQDSSRRDGWGFTVGGGYDFPLGKSRSALGFLTPFVTYAYGEAGDLSHSAITGGIGLTITGNGKQETSNP